MLAPERRSFMHRLRRREARQRYYRPARIKIAAGARARDCSVVDISDGGVRLNVEGLDTSPMNSCCSFPMTVRSRTSAYKVVWRFGNELGATLVSGVSRPGVAERDLVKP